MTIKKAVFLCGLAIAIGLPFFARAAATNVKIISAPQSILTNATSSVFTIESQDDTAVLTAVSTTTRVSLASSSTTGVFFTASASACNTATTSSITISNNTAHKSFCYIDSTAGTYSITIAVLNDPSVLGDSQTITITDPTSTPTPSPSPSPAATSTIASSTPLTQSLNIKIYRFLPNPSGTDTDNEWIEIKSTESQDVLLDGWLLDDAGSVPGSSALVLSGLITPGEVKRIMLTGSVFALNNSGGDEVNLYFSDSSLADKASYSAAAYDDGIFELLGGVWQPPALPQTASSGGGGSSGAAPPAAAPSVKTPTTTPAVLNVIISEILPNPAGDDDEFVELFNNATTSANLDGVVLQIGTRKKTFKGISIQPKKFLVVYEDDLPVRLSNNGQTIKLLDAGGAPVAEVVYPKTKSGQAYASDDGKNYVWTSSATPEAANTYILGESITAEKEKTPAKESNTSSAVTKAQANAILSASNDLKQQVAVLQESVNQLQAKLDSQPLPAAAPAPAEIAPEPNQAANQTPMGRLLVWPAAFAALGGAVYVTFKKLKK